VMIPSDKPNAQCTKRWEKVIFIVYLLFLLLLLVTTFMQGIRNYIPETNHVSRVYSLAGIVYLPIYATCNGISRVRCCVLLRQYFPKYVCCAQYGLLCISL